MTNRTKNGSSRFGTDGLLTWVSACLLVLVSSSIWAGAANVAHKESAVSLAASENGLERIISLSPAGDFERKLHAAVEAVNQGQVDVLRFSPGEFRIPKGLKLRKRIGEGGLRISGAGPGITKLVFSCKETAIEVQLATGAGNLSESPSFLLEDLSLIASGKCGTAVDFKLGDQSTKGGTAAKVFSNLTIAGEKGGSWAAGIKATDLTFCSFRDITLRLPREGAIGIHITGNNAPVDHHLSGIRILLADTGIKVGGNVEGVYIDQVTMIGVDVGIDWDTTGHEPLLSFSGSHISARKACVRLNNALQPLIIGNLLYQAGSTMSWTGIDLRTEKSTAYDLLQISNNIFHGNPKHTAPNAGLSINAASAGAINGNVFSACDDGIKLGKKAAGIKPANNVFKGCTRDMSIAKKKD